MKKLQLGSCVYYVGDNGIEHPYFVITEPFGSPPSVIAVNITGYDPSKDQTVVLERGHAAISKKSVVAYRFTLSWNVEELEKELNDGECRTMLHQSEPECTMALVEKLRKGLLLSRATPIKYKRLMKDLLND